MGSQGPRLEGEASDTHHLPGPGERSGSRIGALPPGLVLFLKKTINYTSGFTSICINHFFPSPRPLDLEGRVGSAGRDEDKGRWVGILAWTVRMTDELQQSGDLACLRSTATDPGHGAAPRPAGTFGQGRKRVPCSRQVQPTEAWLPRPSQLLGGNPHSWTRQCPLG